MASEWGFQNGPSFNGPIWSISVEILVYLMFFLILRHINKSIFVNIIIIIFCILAKFFKIPFSNLPIVSCIALFYMGGISAILFKFFETKKYKIFLNTILILTLILIL